MRYIIVVISLFFSHFVSAQSKNGIISGPMLGQVELRTASLWLEVSPDVKSVALKFNAINADKKATGKESGIINYKGELGKEFNPIKFVIGGLKINTAYQYTLLLNGKEVKFPFATKFVTKDLWQWRKPAPDFTFLTGSCAYFNEPEFDRPGKPYGGDSSIFETMGKTPAAFMLWLGDNWYTREVDYASEWGLWYRASRDRSLPILQPLLSSMSHYAIWDDHDYGPNDIDGSYILKNESRNVFKNYWDNPSCGEDGKGVYSKVSYSDADIFLTDDRFFRSADDMPDSVNGQPNKEKEYFGHQQMEWLKNALLFSKATFKIIATGSQVLNPVSTFECMHAYPAEYYELLEFLDKENIKGVLFFTGDRHHSEVIKLDRPGNYTLYDVTSSPLTSGIGKVQGAEKNNPVRLPGTLVEEQNFTKVTVSGKKGERKMTIEFLGIKGNKLGEWSVEENELNKKK
ncbi:MAG: alkaline phosphatase family protein [Sphingobacteriales bacterium]|nr:alkaline phosphatase family protein [Sphingobacteriales bacterium]